MDHSIVYASESHIDAIAKVGYEAFLQVSSRHGLPPDFPSCELAGRVYKMLVERPDYYGVVAIVDRKVVGSNFLSITDSVSGVGPISVDPQFHGQGIGRSLMMDVLSFASRHSINQVRLLQDAHNLTSLSLYSSLGFDVRDAVALITTSEGAKPDPFVRPITIADLPEIERLSRSLTGNSRMNEVAVTMDYGFPGFLREIRGEITGYLLPGLVGHGVSQAEDDAMALAFHAAKAVPPVLAKLFCPMRYGDFARGLIAAGGKIEKTLTYMTLGPYDYPKGISTPSASY